MGGRIVGAGPFGVSTSTEGADVQEAVGKSAAQVIEVVAHLPASLIEDWPYPLIDSLRHGDINCRIYCMSTGLGMMGDGGAMGDKGLKT